MAKKQLQADIAESQGSDTTDQVEGEVVVRSITPKEELLSRLTGHEGNNRIIISAD